MSDISNASIKAFKSQLFIAGREDIERFLFAGKIWTDTRNLSKDAIDTLLDSAISNMSDEAFLEQMNNYGFTRRYVTMKVEGRFVTPVFAKDADQARQLAVCEYQNADFGQLSDIDAEDIMVENEEGDFEWER